MSDHFPRSQRETLSRLMTKILRHNAVNENLAIRPDGFVSLSSLLDRPKLRSLHATLPRVQEVVQHDAKSRFTLRHEGDGYWIRANQGHSVPLPELALTPITDPSAYPVVLHGTNLAAYACIREDGLRRMKRNHIHLATGRFGVVKSGVRKNCEVFVYIDIARAMAAGIQFEESSNGVILTAGVDGILGTEYFSHVETADGTILYRAPPQPVHSPSDAGDLQNGIDGMTLVETKKRLLFGETVSIAVPAGFIDASEIRQVPDAQEVFLDPQSQDTSFVVELVDALPCPDAQVAREHYAALASDNDARQHTIDSCESMARTTEEGLGERFLVLGTQSVAKFNMTTVEDICIGMGIIRLPKVSTDVLITYNAPISKREQARLSISAALDTFRIVDWKLFPECN